MDDVGKPKSSPLLAWLGRPTRAWGAVVLAIFVVSAPAFLYFDPLNPIPRDALQVYRLHSDDYPYIAHARTFSRTVRNLFVPHNTHVVPAWRVICWLTSATSGRLERLPEVLATSAYGILVAVMLLTGRVVARETGRMRDGFVAMAVVGVTSIMRSPACWFSAGQTLWAGFGILATLHYLQAYRISGGKAKLVLAGLSAILAGWCWTIGYVAGPVGTVYLWMDGRPRCLRMAMIPLAATMLAVGLGYGLGGRQIDSRVSFHGRTVKQAADPAQGVLHTVQAIPENLGLGTVGLTTETTEWQGVVLTTGLLLAWLGFRRERWQFGPLECAGGLIMTVSYLVEWTARGYLPFSSLRGVVPWYDAVPEIGAVLFVAGWIGAPSGSKPTKRPEPITRLGVLGIILLTAALVILNRPRVEALWAERVPKMTKKELEIWKIPSLRQLRNNNILFDQAEWHRRGLRKLDAAEKVCQRLGIDRETIRAVFGRVDAPELPAAYDAADLLDLPAEGTLTNPERVRRALAEYFTVEPEPRPKWVGPEEKWPPPVRPPGDS